MNQRQYQDYFLSPAEPSHRRYAAVRCVIVDEQPMQEVARRFGVSYGTIRNWASEFRRQLDADEQPPFSLRRCAGGPRASRPTWARRR